MKIYVLALLTICVLHVGHTQTITKRMFIFGHSLIDHRPPLIATPSNETTVPHWVYLLAQSAGNDLAAGGQYGFLPQHANLPPIVQWGYDSVPGVWESDYEPFAAAEVNTVLLTAGNFMQWQAPDLDYPTDPGITPISATETVFNWVVAQEDSVKFYIYENWPDMAPYLSSGFPPSANEFEQYNAFTVGNFHDWWLEYHDALLASRPNLNVRMIPVGPIIAGLLTDLFPNQIPLLELYEDDAPHGRATTYFLAGLVTYMAVYEEKAPLTFTSPSIIHPTIASNYEDIVDYIWAELQGFNLPNGESRVFCAATTSDNVLHASNSLKTYPNPASERIFVEKSHEIQQIVISDIFRKSHKNIRTNGESTLSIDIENLAKGLYFIQFRTVDSGTVHVSKFFKN